MEAKKLPSGRWRARAYNKLTGSTKSFTADTKKEAERLASAYEFRESRHSDVTFETAAEQYIMSKSSILSPNTIKDYRNSLNHHLSGIKPKHLDRITDSAIQALVNELAESLSPKSVKNIYGFITAVMRSHGFKREMDITMPRKEKKEIHIPSEMEMQTILDAVKDTDLEIPVNMALRLCLRRGEIAAILEHKECVTDSEIIVKYNMIRNKTGWSIKVPKTFSSFRTIPCPPDLIAKIRNTPPVHPDHITDRWTKLMKKLKMDYRFHDIRHMSASMMLALGIPITDVEKIGGWRHGSSVLQGVYVHTMDESLKRSAEKWHNKMSDFH